METLPDFEDLQYRYTVGIDLGTTNCAVAYVDRARKDTERRLIRFLEMPQLTAPGELGRRPILPSFLYLPGAYELPEGSTALPWDPQRSYVVGELAREQGALVPGRLVASAKSWLCHGGVDRTAAILPWGAGTTVDKVPPVEASARFLQHIREVWNAVMAHGREGYLLEEQMIVLTVPASFDEVARELTVNAAHQAGLPRVVLVEEPLAAFYSWLARHETDWRTTMHAGQVILVCDVGGGTTDFTIVAVREGEKGLRFDRLAVGEHLMLGGDNMDLALARHVEMQLLGRPGQLDSKRWHQLWHQCRKAKETLLAAAGDQPDRAVDITVTGSGSKLIADTLKSRLTLQDVERIIIEGFFPAVSRHDTPTGARRTGLTEWGLPYVQDPAITRHMAAFWQRFAALLQQETGRGTLYPDYLLFNGGALAPASIRQRIIEVVQSWFQEQAGPQWIPGELGNPRPELAVAMGAAYYGMVRLGDGVRVGAGSPRAYYLEVAAEAQPAEEEATPHTALCVVARGTEEGFATQLTQPAFQVLANQPVAFQLYSSSTRLGDQLGDLVTLTEEEITTLPPIRTVLRFGKKGSAQTLPVQLAAHLTEIGTLELWCESQQTPHRWQLQFDVRQEVEAEGGTVAGETLEAELIDLALQKIREVFEKQTGNPDAPRRLMKELVATLDLSKEKWPTPLIRKMADTLLECRTCRTASPSHEARWLNLLGYCLRPGFGDPVDEWRIREVWKIFPQGVHFHRQVQNRSEWWIFWRRIAGGLTAGQQWHIYQQLSHALQPVPKKKKKGGKKPAKSLSVQEELEAWMMLANFERLPAASKGEVGDLILEKISKSQPKPQELWAIGRLGARIPFYGPLDQVIPATAAASWLTALLNLNPAASDALARALVQLARRTGDRERDLPAAELDRLTVWLSPLPQGKRLCDVLSNPETTLGTGEQDWIFGEALPTGLVMVEE